MSKSLGRDPVDGNPRSEPWVTAADEAALRELIGYSSMASGTSVDFHGRRRLAALREPHREVCQRIALKMVDLSRRIAVGQPGQAGWSEITEMIGRFANVLDVDQATDVVSKRDDAAESQRELRALLAALARQATAVHERRLVHIEAKRRAGEALNPKERRKARIELDRWERECLKKQGRGLKSITLPDPIVLRRPAVAADNESDTVEEVPVTSRRWVEEVERRAAEAFEGWFRRHHPTDVHRVKGARPALLKAINATSRLRVQNGQSKERAVGALLSALGMPVSSRFETKELPGEIAAAARASRNAPRAPNA